MCCKKQTSPYKYSKFPNSILSLTNRIILTLLSVTTHRQPKHTRIWFFCVYITHSLVLRLRYIEYWCFKSNKSMRWQWYIFGFNNYGNLCYNVVSGRRISRAKLKYDWLFIKSYQLSIVPIYGTGVTVAYLGHNN